MALLEVHDLAARYGAIQALRGVSFHIDEGQVVSLIGANGAGKSTTLNTISGILKPTAGRVIFDGRDITGWQPHKVTHAGLVQVPEGRQIIASMTVAENLSIGVRSRNTAEVERELDGIYTRFPRLKERRHQKAGLLSGGEQQMLAVGRALMMQPRLLMLDEPSMGLAPLLVNEVFAIIEAIAAQGIPILLVEQNAHKALQIADEVYVLERGRVLKSGTAADLRADEGIVAAYLG